MLEYIEKRKKDLRTELQTGQQMLIRLDAQRADLQETMLRISGALQALSELSMADIPEDLAANTQAV
jgi:prefoldin subunit 5